MEINLSAYQSEVFLRTEELYSTQGYNGVPLFEDEYRLSKATAEYIRDNVDVNTGTINNDAARTYNAVLGITLAGSSSNTGATGVDLEGNSEGGSENSFVITLQGPFLTEFDARGQSYSNIIPQPNDFDYTDTLGVGTSLFTSNTPIDGGYYIFRNTTERSSIYRQEEDLIIEVNNGNSGGDGSVTAFLPF
jgi:hypothetical protein